MCGANFHTVFINFETLLVECRALQSARCAYQTRRPADLAGATWAGCMLFLNQISSAGRAESMVMDRQRHRTRYLLGMLLALAFGSIATMLSKYGTGFLTQAVFILWAVLFGAAVMVFRPRE
jgi:hypothetical protein